MGYSVNNPKPRILLKPDILADYLELEYSDYFGNNKIDRAQLYGEIKFHVAMWDMGILKSRANPAEIDIYLDGSVVDE